MQKGITIGMDLGDKKHQVCILDPAGKIIAEKEVAGNRTAMASFFKQNRGAVVAMEPGTHSRWVSQIAEAEGLKVLVGNARKLRMIWQSRQKSDTRDAMPGRRRWAVDGAGVCAAVGRTGAVRQESHGRPLSWIGPAARSIGAN